MSLFFLSLFLKVHCAFSVLYYSFIVKIGLNFFVRTLSMHFPLKLPSPHFFWSYYCLNVCITGFMLSPTFSLRLSFFLFFFFLPRSIGCEILVFQPGLEPRLRTVKALSLNHWLVTQLTFWKLSLTLFLIFFPVYIDLFLSQRGFLIQ